MEQLVTFSPNSDFKLAHYPLLAFVAPGAGLCTLEGMNENAFRVPVGRFARVLLTVVAMTLSAAAPCRADKAALSAAIEARAEPTWQAALQIWEWAEPGYQEEKSSALLAQMLEHEGFKVERGVAGIPTAFTAEAGEGPPVIAILGEYDALPGLSQQAVPEQSPRVPGGYGQGCGHHLFGTASAAAAMAVAERLKKDHLPGTVRFYGCPAEEGGAAKVFMVRAGLFNDCDVALHWHPGSRNAAGDATCLARIAAKFRFRGTSAMPRPRPSRGVRPWTRWN